MPGYGILVNDTHLPITGNRISTNANSFAKQESETYQDGGTRDEDKNFLINCLNNEPFFYVCLSIVCSK